MTEPARTTTRRSTADIERIYRAYRARYPAPKPQQPPPLTAEALEQALTRRPPRLPSRPPTINGRPALRGEIF
ncbi:MAG: hypothetical protein ACLPKT_06050 [Methylocella sp.]